jgi:hypothetical protein
MAFILLVLQYLIGLSKDTNLDESTNPVDQQVLSFIWRNVGKPPARWGGPLKDVSAASYVEEYLVVDARAKILPCRLSWQ